MPLARIGIDPYLSSATTSEGLKEYVPKLDS
jgi:hypothetical protein